jgi:integrase
MRTVKPRAVNGYWTIQPRIDGKRTTRTFGAVAEVSYEAACLRVREWFNSHRTPSAPALLTVRKLAESYLAHAEQFYRHATGEQTGEAANHMYALAPFTALFGAMAANEIRPRHLRHYMDAQAKADVSRQTINKRLGILKRWLKWAVGAELLPPDVFMACQFVPGIRAGKGARESKKIGPVPIETVRQTLPNLPPTVRDMVELQMLSAMRPEEVCAMRLCDINTTGENWLYVPAWHKNAHRGHERRVWLGPRAIEIVKRHMAGKGFESPLFSPREAVRERRGKYPTKRISACYDTRSYRKAIWYACDKAWPAPDGTADAQKWLRANRWSPNRLRHLKADEVRTAFGAQHAKAYAGHSRVETTQEHYLSQDDALAQEVARKVG